MHGLHVRRTAAGVFLMLLAALCATAADVALAQKVLQDRIQKAVAAGIRVEAQLTYGGVRDQGRFAACTESEVQVRFGGALVLMGTVRLPWTAIDTAAIVQAARCCLKAEDVEAMDALRTLDPKNPTLAPAEVPTASVAQENPAAASPATVPATQAIPYPGVPALPDPTDSWRRVGAQAFQDLAKAVADAKTLPAEDVGTPVQSVRFEGVFWAPNPDGKTWDLLVVYFKEYGGPNEIVVLDLGAGREMQRLKIPRDPTRHNWHLPGRALSPDGKLYFSTLCRGLRVQIDVYDPAANRLQVAAVPVPDYLHGETHPLVRSTDGKMVALGAHTNKAAGAMLIDPATNQVTTFPPIGPSHAPDDCWGYSGAADDTHIYVASGKVPWYLVALERSTGKSTVLATTERVGGFIGVHQHAHGCSASVTVGEGKPRQDYWLLHGKLVPRADRNRKDDTPWKEPATPAPAAPPQPELYLENATPRADGLCQLWYRPPAEKEAGESRLAKIPADKRSTLNPEDFGWHRIEFTVETYSMGISRLTELPDGRLLGTAGAYEGNFVFDPSTKASEHLGKIPLSHYATCTCDGKVYMSGYPTSPVYVYDPARPWTATIGGAGPLAESEGARMQRLEAPTSNPRFLGYLKAAGTHKMYAAAAGADGKVYFGGRWYRNGQGGGLGWCDTKTQALGGIWEIFSNYQVNYMNTASDGRYVVISTHRVEDSVLKKPKPKQGKLFIWDTQAQKIVREIEPVMEAKGAGLVQGLGGACVLGWTENPADAKASSILYGVQVESGEVLFRQTIPFALPVSLGGNQGEPFDFRLGPDGRLWTLVNRVLVSIDPQTLKVEVAGRLDPPGRFAFAGRDLYLTGDAALRCVRGVLPGRFGRRP